MKNVVRSEIRLSGDTKNISRRFISHYYHIQSVSLECLGQIRTWIEIRIFMTIGGAKIHILIRTCVVYRIFLKSILKIFLYKINVKCSLIIMKLLFGGTVGIK